MNAAKYNLTDNQNVSPNNYSFYNCHGNIESLPNINSVSNQIIKNSFSKAYQSNNYLNNNDNNNINTFYCSNKFKNFTSAVRPTLKEESKITLSLNY